MELINPTSAGSLAVVAAAANWLYSAALSVALIWGCSGEPGFRLSKTVLAGLAAAVSIFGSFCTGSPLLVLFRPD